MKALQLSVAHDILPLKEPFKISRGAKTEANVIVIILASGANEGKGEAVPYAHYGETIQSVMAEIENLRATIENGITHAQVQDLLPAGAARNALDCALWDLAAKSNGTTVAEMIGVDHPKGLETAVTIGIDTADKMAAKASLYRDYPLLKVKLDQNDIRAKVTAIRKAAPKPRIIIDPNESWTMQELTELDDFFVAQKIDLLEQPLPVDADAGLMAYKGKTPICADESCHTRADLEGLQGKYQVVNIKLDKSGGLSEAIKLKQTAQGMGFDIMVGCMVASSLAMAPAMLLASGADFIDLDGPIWLSTDRPHGLQINKGVITELPKGLWGGGLVEKLSM